MIRWLLASPTGLKVPFKIIDHMVNTNAACYNAHKAERPDMKYESVFPHETTTKLLCFGCIGFIPSAEVSGDELQRHLPDASWFSEHHARFYPETILCMPCGANAVYRVQEYSEMPPFVNILKAACAPALSSPIEPTKPERTPHLVKREPAGDRKNEKEPEVDKLVKSPIGGPTGSGGGEGLRSEREDEIAAERYEQEEESYRYQEIAERERRQRAHYERADSKYFLPFDYTRNTRIPTRSAQSSPPRTPRETLDYTYRNYYKLTRLHHPQTNDDVGQRHGNQAEPSDARNYGYEHTSDCIDASNPTGGREVSKDLYPDVDRPRWEDTEDFYNYSTWKWEGPREFGPSWKPGKDDDSDRGVYIVTYDGDPFYATNVQVWRRLPKEKKAKLDRLPDGNAWRINDIMPGENVKVCVDIWQQKGHRVGVVLTMIFLLPLMSTWSDKGKHV